MKTKFKNERLHVSNTICLLIVTIETQTPCAARVVAMATTSSTKQSSTRKSRKGKDASAEKDKEDFEWTDDESELLLNIAHEYKVSKTGDSVDWESVKNKQEDIFERFVAELPDEPPSVKEKEHIKFGLVKDFCTLKVR